MGGPSGNRVFEEARPPQCPPRTSQWRSSESFILGGAQRRNALRTDFRTFAFPCLELSVPSGPGALVYVCVSWYQPLPAARSKGPDARGPALRGHSPPDVPEGTGQGRGRGLSVLHGLRSPAGLKGAQIDAWVLGSWGVLGVLPPLAQKRIPSRAVLFCENFLRLLPFAT